jgi:hypothetical protein
MYHKNMKRLADNSDIGSSSMTENKYREVDLMPLARADDDDDDHPDESEHGGIEPDGGWSHGTNQ